MTIACTCLNLLFQVGVFGYIIYYERDIPGDILIAFSETTVAFVLKLCELLASVVVYVSGNKSTV